MEILLISVFFVDEEMIYFIIILQNFKFVKEFFMNSANFVCFGHFGVYSSRKNDAFFIRRAGADFVKLFKILLDLYIGV